jgi:hypothetical protein
MSNQLKGAKQKWTRLSLFFEYLFQFHTHNQISKMISVKFI